MFRGIFSTRLLIVGIVFFALVAASTQLYSWYVKHTTEAELERHDQFLQGLENRNEIRPVQAVQAVNLPTENETLGETPEEIDDLQVSEDTDVSPIDEASEFADVADGFLPNDFVLEEEPAEDVLVSSYGFGPYPELPEGWPADTFPAPSADHELMTRVRIKLLSQGVDVTGSTMENGLIYSTIKGIAYVKWKEYERPTGTIRYISELLATGEAGKRLHTIRVEKGKSLTSEDIPADIKLVPFKEGAIDPYQFLDLP